jgi:acetyl esterase/lipase
MVHPFVAACCSQRAISQACSVALYPINSLLKTIFVLWSLARRLASLLGSSPRWMWLSARLMCFSMLISPALLQLVPYYCCSRAILRNLRYGPHRRNDYDIFTPASGVSFVPGTDGVIGRPIVILVCGGAWMIGYKLWTLALCRNLASCGVIAISIDYRNFPQVK